MTSGIKTVIYPVKDLAQAKALYGNLHRERSGPPTSISASALNASRPGARPTSSRDATSCTTGTGSSPTENGPPDDSCQDARFRGFVDSAEFARGVGGVTGRRAG